MRITIKNPNHQAAIIKIQELLASPKPSEALAAFIELKANALIAELIAVQQPNPISAATTAVKLENSVLKKGVTACPESDTKEHFSISSPQKGQKLAGTGHKKTPPKKGTKINSRRRSLNDAVE